MTDHAIDVIPVSGTTRLRARPMTAPPPTTRSPLASPRAFLPNNAIALVVTALLIAQAGLTAWALSTTWFFADDFTYLHAITGGEGVIHWMISPYNGHLLPGSFLATWLLQLPAPMEWAWFAAAIVVMQFVASLLTWKVLRSIFGERPFSLVLFVIYVTSVIMFATELWWAAAIEYLPIQIGLPATILLFQRAVTRPGWINALLPGLSLALTLFFFEKALIIGAFVIILWLLAPITPTAEGSVRGRLRQGATPIIVLVSITVAHLLLYLALTSGSETVPDLSMSAITEMRLGVALDVLIPTIIGGPHGFSGHLADPGPFEKVLSLGVLAGALVVSAATRRVWLRYWIALSGLIAVNVIVLTASGRRFITEPRYLSDLVLPMLLLIGLAVIGSRFDTSGRRRWFEDIIDARPLGPSTKIVSGVVIAVLLLVGTTNLIEERPRFARTDGEEYVSAARASIDALAGPIELFSQPAPKSILPPVWFGSRSTTEFLLTPLSPRLKFADQASSPHLVLPDGHLSPAGVSASFSAALGDGPCVEVDGDGGPTVLTLDRTAFEWRRFGEITITADRPGGLTIIWDGEPAHIDYSSGTSTIVFPIEGSGASVTLRPDPVDGSICVSRLVFGNLEPTAPSAGSS